MSACRPDKDRFLGVLAAVRASFEETEDFFREQLRDLDRLNGELTSEAGRWRSELTEEMRAHRQSEQARETAAAELERLATEQQQLWEMRTACSEAAEQLARERAAWERQLAEQQSELAQRQAELEAERLAMSQRRELPVGVAAARADEEFQQLTARVAELEEERVRWLEDRQRLRTQAARLQEAAAQLSTTQQALAAAQSEFNQRQSTEQQLWKQLEREWLERVQSLDTERNRLAAELQTSRESLSLWQARCAEQQTRAEQLERVRLETLETGVSRGEGDAERAALEAELELVRRRAAELTEEGERQQALMEQERARWKREFEQLQQLLEMQHELEQATSPVSDRRPASVAKGKRGVRQTAEPARAAEHHAALDQVLAQFESIQRERKRRRVEGSQEVA